MTDRWLQSAFTNDLLVAELLLRVKHSSDSDSLRAPPPAATTTSTPILPPRWGHRKNRSKSTAPTTTVTNAGKEHRASPTTHLSWSGGGASTSDGYDESSRPSHLSSGGRSVKVNESASTTIYHKFEKRKIYINEDEMTSMRVTLNQNKMRVIGDRERQMKLPQSCRVEAETFTPQKGFILPDLNMTPNEEGFAMMMS